MFVYKQNKVTVFGVDLDIDGVFISGLIAIAIFTFYLFIQLHHLRSLSLDNEAKKQIQNFPILLFQYNIYSRISLFIWLYLLPITTILIIYFNFPSIETWQFILVIFSLLITIFSQVLIFRELNLVLVKLGS